MGATGTQDGFGERFVLRELAYGRVKFVAGLKTRGLAAEKGRSVLRPYGRWLPGSLPGDADAVSKSGGAVFVDGDLELGSPG